MTTTMTSTVRPPQVGEKARNITLPNTTAGNTWNLQEALRNGPVVLAFMPGAFTGTCTKEGCNFTANLNQYTQIGAQVVGITVDSKHAQSAWAARDNIQIPLLSDFEKRTVNEWGLAWASGWGVTTRRATFVVDRNGTIRYANVQANASEEPNYAEIQAALRGLK